MKHSYFVHLHLHTQYSLLDGAIKIEELIKAIRDFKMPAVAITDHGNMFGAIEFYSKALKAGIKPIIGCELYLSKGSRFDKQPKGLSDNTFHLILLAKNYEGYKNLIKIVSIGYLEGLYYKPRIDKEILEKYNEGLIALSSCIHGEIPSLLLAGEREKAYNAACFYKDVFGDRFYFEIQRNGVERQDEINNLIIEMSKKLSIKIVATNDCHYLTKNEARAHDILLCIQTNRIVNDKDRLRFPSNEFYVKSYEEMYDLFKDIPESLKNTIEIAEKCNLEIKFGEVQLPEFNPPGGENLDHYLERISRQGLEERFLALGIADNPVERSRYLKRLNDELQIIKSMGYSGYFLIVSDFINYARRNNIPVGPGRGSAAGSLVAYALRITDIDPIRYGLLFERFLNPERITLPDIDVDFCMERRDEVIKYVTDKYGKDRVAQIITFGTMQARAVIRDVGRALDMSYGEVDKIAKLVPNIPNITLEEAFEREQKLRELVKEKKEIKDLYEIAKKLEGLTRHASTHAAGVVISNRPLVDTVPLYKDNKGEITTQYAKDDIEKIGLVKFDFLGLKTLTQIKNTIEIIEQRRGIKIDISKIPFDDKKTYGLLCEGDTTGVFQLESPGMRDIMIKMRPSCLEDIIALVALYRPGPLGSNMIDDFIKRKNGVIEINYEIDELKEILDETYGVIVYQEQVMNIASKIAGFSLGDADILRRAMGKKDPGVMEKQKEKFIKGALSKGISLEKAEKIFNIMLKFAEYGFNKSHSAAYAVLAYQTAYLKANYPVEFSATLLSSEMGNRDKIIQYISECKDKGIEILPPDLNESERDFTVVGDKKIRFGLAAVKNVGEGAIEAIITSRRNSGRFRSIYDFIVKVDSRRVNRRVIESLIKSGAMDFTGCRRAQMIAALDDLISRAQAYHRKEASTQKGLFESTDTNAVEPLLPDIPEWPEAQLLAFEKETLGFYITGHPLAQYSDILNAYATTNSQTIHEEVDGKEVRIGGVISHLKEIATKKGERMAFATLEDLKGSVEVVIFPDLYNKVMGYIKTELPLFVIGDVDLAEEGVKIIAKDLVPVSEAREKLTSRVRIKLNIPGLKNEDIHALKDILSQYPGKCPVFLHLIIPGKGEIVISLPEKFSITPSFDFSTEIEAYCGDGSIVFE